MAQIYPDEKKEGGEARCWGDGYWQSGCGDEGWASSPGGEESGRHVSRGKAATLRSTPGSADDQVQDFAGDVDDFSDFGAFEEGGNAGQGGGRFTIFGIGRLTRFLIFL